MGKCLERKRVALLTFADNIKYVVIFHKVNVIQYNMIMFATILSRCSPYIGT